MKNAASDRPELLRTEEQMPALSYYETPTLMKETPAINRRRKAKEHANQMCAPYFLPSPERTPAMSDNPKCVAQTQTPSRVRVLLSGPSTRWQQDAAEFLGQHFSVSIETQTEQKQVGRHAQKKETVDITIQEIPNDPSERLGFSKLLHSLSDPKQPTPRIIVTTFDRDDLRMMALEDAPGVVAIFRHPLDMATLSAAVRQVAQGDLEGAGLLSLELEQMNSYPERSLRPAC